ATMTAASAFVAWLFICRLFCRLFRITRLAQRIALDEGAAGTHDIEALYVPRRRAPGAGSYRDDVEVEGLHAAGADSEAERCVRNTGRLTERGAHCRRGIADGDLVVHLLERERTSCYRNVDAC